MEQGYEDYQKMIANQAWKWASKSGQDFEELIAEGNLIFMTSQENFDPQKSRFSTYLYKSLNQHFGNLIESFASQKRDSRMIADQDIGLVASDSVDPESYAIFRDILSSLSNDSKLIINSVLETPAELVAMMSRGKKTKMTKKVLTAYFKKQGWGISRIWNAFSEIKQTIA